MSVQTLAMRMAHVLLLALFIVGCGDNLSPAGRAPGPQFVGASLGDTDQVIKWVPAANLPTLTVASSTVILLDTSGGDTVRQRWTTAHRFLVSMRCDQPTTLLYQIKRTASSTWRTMNGYASGSGCTSGCAGGGSPGSGLGDTVPANCDAACDYLVLGPDSRLQVVTTTAPSTCEVDVGYYPRREAGM